MWVAWPGVPDAALRDILGPAGFDVVGMSDLLDSLIPDIAGPAAATAAVVIVNGRAPSVTPARDLLWTLRIRRPDLRVVLLLGEDDERARELRSVALAVGIYDWVLGDDGDTVREGLLDVLLHPRTLGDVAGKAGSLPVSVTAEIPWEEPSRDEHPDRRDTRPLQATLVSGAKAAVGTVGTLFAAATRHRRSTWAKDADGTQAEGRERVPEADDQGRAADDENDRPKGRRGRGRGLGQLSRDAPAFAFGRIVVVIGLHGGAGCSSVTALLAHCVDRAGLRAGVLELAHGGGQILRAFGRGLVEQGVEAGHPPGEVAVERGRGTVVLPLGFGPGASVGVPQASEYLAWLRQCADIILIDAGCDLTWPPVREAVGACDEIVPVFEPTPTGVGSAARFLALADAGRWREKVKACVLNRRATRHLSVPDISDTLGVAVALDIEHMPDDFHRLWHDGRASPALTGTVEPLAERLVVFRPPTTRGRVHGKNAVTTPNG